MFLTNLHSFALFSFHTSNLDVRLEPLKSLFPRLRFGQENDLERSPDKRVMPVWILSFCAGSMLARASFSSLEQTTRFSEILGASILRSSQASFARATRSLTDIIKWLFGLKTLFLSLSSPPILQTRNPNLPNPWFLFFLPKIHPKSFKKDEKQAWIKTFTDCFVISLEFECLHP